jgi:hypothetical protein
VGAVLGLQLAQDTRDMVLHRALGNKQLLGNVFVGFALRQQRQYLALAVKQRIWVGGGRSGLHHFAQHALLFTRRIKTQKFLNLIDWPRLLLFRPLIPQLPNPELAWLTLAGTSTLAGNLTLIGSVANLIVAEQALKFDINLTFIEYLRAGVVITILSLIVCEVWLTFI